MAIVSWSGILPWLTSAMTLWAVWLSGHNLRLSWKVSLTNQTLWCAFIVTSGAWGLLPLTLSLAAIFARHLARPLTAPGRQVLERRPAPDVAPAAPDLERFSESGGPAPAPPGAPVLPRAVLFGHNAVDEQRQGRSEVSRPMRLGAP